MRTRRSAIVTIVGTSADTRVSRRCKGLPGRSLGTRRGASAPYAESAEMSAESTATGTVQVEVSWRMVYEQLDEQRHRPCREQRRTMRRVARHLTHARSGDADDAQVLARLEESNEWRNGSYDPNHVALWMRCMREPCEPIDEMRHD